MTRNSVTSRSAIGSTVGSMESERAKVAALEARNVLLSAADFRQAARLIGDDNRSEALAYLNRSLTSNHCQIAQLLRVYLI